MAYLYNFHCFDHLYLTGIYNYGAQICFAGVKMTDLCTKVFMKRGTWSTAFMYSLHCVRTIKAKKDSKKKRRRNRT